MSPFLRALVSLLKTSPTRERLRKDWAMSRGGMASAFSLSVIFHLLLGFLLWLPNEPKETEAELVVWLDLSDTLEPSQTITKTPLPLTSLATPKAPILPPRRTAPKQPTTPTRPEKKAPNKAPVFTVPEENISPLDTSALFGESAEVPATTLASSSASGDSDIEPSEAAGSGAVGGVLAPNQGEVDYDALLRGLLVAQRHYPPLAQSLLQEGIVSISFSIDARGNVSQIEVLKSSGHRLLDRASVRLLKRITPLPPPPKGPQRFAFTLNYFLEEALTQKD